jgi:hypothetical protein
MIGSGAGLDVRDIRQPADAGRPRFSIFGLVSGRIHVVVMRVSIHTFRGTAMSSLGSLNPDSVPRGCRPEPTEITGGMQEA